ncbi:hypothetical protein [Aeromonas hydrophila]|uniref:hypothetical protein n=1 Tax=Aeromonas hydrophila TaxID=644 RepID=UPI002362B958|nr:hypothetical protein [Aeromonas hydrophila]
MNYVGRARVRIARSALQNAEQRLLETLRSEYPINAEVEVIHSRGSFSGKVVGWNLEGTRVSVYNLASGKTKDWWFENVQNLAVYGGAA